MKVRVTKEGGLKYEGSEYSEGDELEISDEKAEKAIENGIVEAVEEEEEESTEMEGIEDVGITEDQEKRIEALTDKLDIGTEKVNETAREKVGVDTYHELSGGEAEDIIDDLTQRMAESEAEREEAASEVHSPLPAGEAGLKAAQKIEQKDKEQIVREITGKVSKGTAKKWFYSFEQAGETVTGITYDGVMAIFRNQGNIDIIIEDIWKENDEVHVKVRAVDKARNNSIERVTKEPVDRRFAMRIAQSTAEKKAVRALVPDEAVTEMFKQWKSEGK